MAVTFSTESVFSREQVDYWREAICDVFMHLEVDAPRTGPQGFEGRIVQHSEGSLDLSEVLVESHVVIQTARQLHRNDDDSFLVMVQREGESWIEQDGRSGWLRKGETSMSSTAGNQTALRRRLTAQVYAARAPALRTSH